MARKRVKLAWIVNDEARWSTFKKRRKGLLKKAEELSILCGVSTCAIIYNPCKHEPQMWPDQEVVTNIISNFQDIPEIEKSKRMVNQQGYLRQMIVKIGEQLEKLESEGRELELCGLLTEIIRGRPILDLDLRVSTSLMSFIENKKQTALEKIERDRHPDITTTPTTNVASPNTTLPPAEPNNAPQDVNMMEVGEQELLVYPPNLQPSPQDMGHAYVHHYHPPNNI